MIYIYIVTPARDPKQENVLRLKTKRRCRDLVVKIGQPAFGSQGLEARIWKPGSGSNIFRTEAIAPDSSR